MSPGMGDALLVLRRAAGLTQEQLAERVGITQATLSRYENELRDVDRDAAERLAPALGVTAAFLLHEFQMEGAIAADAHMRRQKTARPADWKHVESRLNAHRMHSSFLLERMPMHPKNHVIQIDPDDTPPDDAAAMLRAAWRMPIGPVRNLTRWMESAGIIVLEEDFGTARIDGMSQWAGSHAVILVNSSRPIDRRRLTLAHELGHLVLHGQYVGIDVEEQANAFAAAFLMPEAAIGPDLRNLTLGKLLDLKAVWGVSMQALHERAFQLGKVTSQERSSFYKQMSKRGWRMREPGSDQLPDETPHLARNIGDGLRELGLSDAEVQRLIGASDDVVTPFASARSRLRAVRT
ncbi:helix-turn-helix domain-containing protein [Brachybacterium vulturis]|uniref:helix-turn-helix domain-containing protein n=1 Tax=Brachybacterium vulturis TaxID=2017484 RepID=UPI001C48AB29|nr:XRE family transcriptional regulator [Brachybacterium vulturis]